MIGVVVPSLRRRRLLLGGPFFMVAIAILAAIPASVASAQASYTADGGGISVFGGVSRLDTDYGVNDNGYMIGGDLTLSPRKFRFVTPSLEVRYTGSTGDAITESSFSGGIKIEKGFHRFHPYANLLIGYGAITYVFAGGQSDNSIIYDVGVGLDVDIYRRFAIKVDAQEQFWKLGQATSELTPQMVTVGVRYRLPSSFLHKH
jgi:hypothetical protein